MDQNGRCRFNAKTVGATMTGYTKVPQGSESLLKEAVASVGPISVNIDAGHGSFQSYKSGRPNLREMAILVLI